MQGPHLPPRSVLDGYREGTVPSSQVKDQCHVCMACYHDGRRWLHIAQ